MCPSASPKSDASSERSKFNPKIVLLDVAASVSPLEENTTTTTTTTSFAIIPEEEVEEDNEEDGEEDEDENRDNTVHKKTAESAYYDAFETECRLCKELFDLLDDLKSKFDPARPFAPFDTTATHIIRDSPSLREAQEQIHPRTAASREAR